MRVQEPEMPPVEAVTFDAAGTLFELAEPVGQTYARYGRAHGWSLSAEELEQGFRDAWRAAPRFGTIQDGTRSETGNEREKAWWRNLVAATFSKARDSQHLPQPRIVSGPLFNDLFDHYAHGNAWQLFPETIRTLTRLREKGLPVAVISNFDSRFRQIAEDLGFLSNFAVIQLSGEFGNAKPDLSIFAATADQLSLEPERILHIGDDPGADWQGGREAGYQVFELRRPLLSLENAVHRVLDSP